MNWKVLDVVFSVRSLRILLPLCILILCYTVILALETGRLTQEYHSLNSKLIYYSSIAEKLKMRKKLIAWKNPHLNERIDKNIAEILDKEGIIFNISLLGHDSLLINIENTHLSDLLNTLFVLSTYQDIDIINVKIYKEISENGDHIIGGAISLKKLSKGI
jgi:hypothetical protein